MGIGKEPLLSAAPAESVASGALLLPLATPDVSVVSGSEKIAFS